jgi:ribonuclease/clavin/mitogillin
VQPIIPAASVLLSRGPASREIFTVQRGRQLRFFGGFWAFPGGKLDSADAPGADSAAPAALRRAACRELFEETGLLIARRPDGRVVDGSDATADARRAVLAGSLPFAQFLAERGLQVHADDFRIVGKLTTPPFAAVRFATTFFAARAPQDQRTEVWPGELEAGAWAEPAALLDEWRSGRRLLTPPSVLILQAFGDGRVFEDAPSRVGPALDALATSVLHPIYFAPAVQLVPVRTLALAPSTHTNAFLVGSGPRYLIDPGCDAADEQKVLFGAVDNFGPLTAIILSHHHPDHVGAAAACARRYRVPICAHPLTAERLGGKVAVDRFLDEGDELDLGPRPDSAGRWALRVLHTPGHAPGHLAFFEPHHGLLFAGDMVSTITSIVIMPPDGDLTRYLSSLRRLRELPARLLLPSHGNASADPRQTLDEALAHRIRREEQLLQLLAATPATLDELTAQLYRGLAEPLLPFARAQVMAGLLKLQQEKRVSPSGDLWRAI